MTRSQPGPTFDSIGRRVRAGQLTSFFCLAITASACGGEPAMGPSGAPYTTSGRLVIDAGGATILLRGVNLSQSAKVRPYHPVETASVAGLDHLARGGPVAIRYLTSWAAIEPERGVYDEAYLAELGRRAGELAARGHLLVLDLHQDLFGVGFGSNGAPRWACSEEHYAAYVPQNPWFLGYTTAPMRACFDHLFGDVELLRSMARALRRATVAVQATAGSRLVGVDVLNEPFPGSMDPATFDRERLERWYAEAAGELTGLGLVLLFEPNVLHNTGEPTRLPPRGTPGWAYAPHYYPLDAELGSYSGETAETDRGVAALAAEAATLGSPLIVGEIGPRHVDPRGIQFLDDVHRALDRHLAGVFHWDWSWSSDRGLLTRERGDTDLVRPALRPHARRIAGALTSHRFDPATRTLEVTFTENGAGDPTEIVLPVHWYPDGAIAEVSDGETTESGRLLLFERDPAVEEHRLVVRPR